MSNPYQEEIENTDHFSHRHYFLEMALSGLCLLSFFLVLVIFSYDAADPGWTQTSTAPVTNNLGGPIGAFIADMSFFIFGIGSYFVPCLIIILCLLIYLDNKKRSSICFWQISFRFLGLLLLLISTCTLATLNIDDNPNYSAGGLVGTLFALLLMFNLNGAISTLIMLLTWIIGFTVLTRLSPLFVAEKIGEIVLLTVTFGRSRDKQVLDEMDPDDEDADHFAFMQEQESSQTSDNEAAKSPSPMHTSEDDYPIIDMNELDQLEQYSSPRTQSATDEDDILLSDLNNATKSKSATPDGSIVMIEHKASASETRSDEVKAMPNAGVTNNVNASVKTTEQLTLNSAVQNTSKIDAESIDTKPNSLIENHSNIASERETTQFPQNLTIRETSNAVTDNAKEESLMRPQETLASHKADYVNTIAPNEHLVENATDAMQPIKTTATTIPSTNPIEERKSLSLNEKLALIEQQKRTNPIPPNQNSNNFTRETNTSTTLSLEEKKLAERERVRAELANYGIKIPASHPVKAHELQTVIETEQDRLKEDILSKNNYASNTVSINPFTSDGHILGRVKIDEFTEGVFEQINDETIIMKRISTRAAHSDAIFTPNISAPTLPEMPAVNLEANNANVSPVAPHQSEERYIDAEIVQPQTYGASNFHAVESEHSSTHTGASNHPTTEIVTDQINHSDAWQKTINLDNGVPPNNQTTSNIANANHTEISTANPVQAEPVPPNYMATNTESSVSQRAETSTPNTSLEHNDFNSDPMAITHIDEGHDENSTVNDMGSKFNDNPLFHPLLFRETERMEKPAEPLPTLDLLFNNSSEKIEIDQEQINETAMLIESTLADFRIKVTVVGICSGPVITRYELELAPGVKVSRITTLDRDLARALSVSAVRVVEVIPGKPYVGLELPNPKRETLVIRDVLNCDAFREMQSPLALVLGKDIGGEPVVANLAKMPHLLVAGTTGSGKSVGVNAMIISILFKASPEEVRFIMIDPKMLELSIYEGIPHLLTKVVTDMKDAANALRWSVAEMERRYKLMAALGVRNLEGYNEKIKQAELMERPIPDPFWKPSDSMDINIPSLEKLPFIVVIVDEFADLIMTEGKKVEELIARLAQKARAAGIHLILATQRPSVDVITGLIKANIPTRIAFTVSSKIDSRTILDQGGAESLLGAGDMLYLPPNSSTTIRVHGAFVADEEVHNVVSNWKARGRPQYIEAITAGEKTASEDESGEEEIVDAVFDAAVQFVIEKQRVSISGIQRQFRIGYNRAARIVEEMEAQGIVSPPAHNGNREVLAQ